MCVRVYDSMEFTIALPVNFVVIAALQPTNRSVSCVGHVYDPHYYYYYCYYHQSLNHKPHFVDSRF